MHKILKLLLVFAVASCAQVTSLNLQKHQFGKIPTKIIWIQVAGLSKEHISMLKYSYPTRSYTTSFENSLCVGDAWEYNLFKLRPSAYEGFLSQMTGKKNIKNTCNDFDRKPIWSYLEKQNYRTGIFEGEATSDNSLLKSKQCKDQSGYLSGTTFWSMNKSTINAKTFHASDRKTYTKGQVYFDKSCKSAECFSTLSQNVETTYQNFTKNAQNFLYIVRNFKFAELIRKNKVKAAKEELNQIEKILRFFQKEASKRNDTLVLLTSSETFEVDFPKVGKQWKAYEKNGAFLKSRNTKLISPVFASGARAENFCGIYDQSQVLARIFSGAKQQGLEFSIINPFE